MNLDDALREALRREEPRAGFGRRVTERLPGAARLRARWRAAAAASLILLTGGGWLARQEYQRQQGERARDEVLLALRITSEKVQKAQQEVLRQGIQEVNK